MYLKELSSYLSGLTNMASYVSKEIGPSYIEADCFDKKDYIKCFANLYKISEDIVKLEEYNYSMEDILNIWLGTANPDIVNGLIHWIRIHIGNPKKVYITSEDTKLENMLGIGDGGNSSFYCFEQAYFVEFEKVVVVFSIGNDE